MKKVIALLLIAILAIGLLAACGSRANDSAGYWASDMMAETDTMLFSDDSDSLFRMANTATAPAPAMAPTVPVTEMAAPDSAPGGGHSADMDTGGVGERIIHTVRADIETLEFDETIAMIYAMIEQVGGYIEYSHESGRPIAQQHQGRPAHRTANFTLRIPQNRINSVAGDLDRLGNVTALIRNAQNVTAQFIDTESRLTALRIQEERLMYMLEQATRIADMIEIEWRVSDVRSEIERLTTSLIHLQSRVDFSTLTLYIMEVEELTEITPLHRTYWQRVGDGFSSTMRAIGRFFMDVFRYIATALPVIIIVIVILVPGVIIIRKKIRSRRKAKLAESLLPEETSTEE